MTKLSSRSISTSIPAASDDRRSKAPIVCYEVDHLPAYDADLYQQAKESMEKIDEVVVPPRDGRHFQVPAGHFFRIVSVEGPQVGDLNLWNANDLNERFFSGKTRQLHASHLSTGDRLWSTMPYLRPMATITQDTLDWYGWDEDGAGVHDVIGTRCDPYTNHMLKHVDYNHCCHSNLTRALADARGLSLDGAEPHVHDVMNVFMCTGFTRDTHQYFMKPVRFVQGTSSSFLPRLIFWVRCPPARVVIVAAAILTITRRVIRCWWRSSNRPRAACQTGRLPSVAGIAVGTSLGNENGGAG